jgi:ribosomal protein L40E
MGEDLAGRVCAACGAKNKPGARFCANCGKGLAATCADCGASLPLGALFCAKCGKSVKATGAKVEVAPATSSAAKPAATSAVAAPQYSADGKWWWDGQQWVAVVSPPTQFSADGKWWWNGRDWSAVTAQPAAPAEVTKLHKNAWSLPPGEYTTDRKWRLEGGTWVKSGKWKWEGKTYVKVGEGEVDKNESGPSEKLLGYGRHLIFRDGKSQTVDANRHATSWRM